MKIDKWIDVVTNPLGLAGFALFLLFLLVAKWGGPQRVTMRRVFVGLAVFSVVGGFTLAYRNQAGPTEVVQTKQDTRGSVGSPAVSGVGGNVEIRNEFRGDVEPLSKPDGQ